MRLTTDQGSFTCRRHRYEVPSPPKLLQIYCYANLFTDYCFLHYYEAHFIVISQSLLLLCTTYFIIRHGLLLLAILYYYCAERILLLGTDYY